MKIQCKWNDKMKFTAEANNHSVDMDTTPPLGTDSAFSPKQLLLSAICGCTAMDVVALLKKYKQPLESFTMEADSTLTEGSHPTVFKEVKLLFKLKGELDTKKVLESVTLSQTKYCSVSAMVSKAVPITWAVELNGKNIGTGEAGFKF